MRCTLLILFAIAFLIPNPRREPNSPASVASRRGMVASPHYLATESGLRVLRAGGNAVDAAIATNAVLAVVTLDHPPLNLFSRARQYAQIHDDALRIRHLGAPFPRLFRPPYGLYDGRTLSVLRRLKMLMVMWSVDPRDWVRPGTQAIVRRVLRAARPGTIVELHDGGGDRSQTAAALPAIITALRRRQYQLVTVPELLAGAPPPHHQPLPHLSE